VVVRQAVFRLSQEPHLRKIATTNPVTRSMALRFFAGETLDDAVRAMQQINARGMSGTLDHLGENVRTPAEAQEATEALCTCLRRMKAAGLDCNLSLKLTQLGLDLDEERASRNLGRVLDVARELGTFVRIDMESSEYVDRTLQLFTEVKGEYPNVGVVIQSYLYRSKKDLQELVKVGARVRLVKGAYLEPERVAFPNKLDVDANYLRLTRTLLEEGVYSAIATHDPAMIDAARRYASELQVSRSDFEFQMLFGVRRDLQDHLLKQGYRVRIYTPYGTQWYPYFMRRLAERPANVMFLVGNVAREATAARRRAPS
jgi:proline dehydrogenase